MQTFQFQQLKYLVNYSFKINSYLHQASNRKEHLRNLLLPCEGEER